jgi:uracil-DNA glycosylase family 4
MTNKKVPGYGPDDAKILIVGEAPASQEVRVGLPFQGRAGEELDKLLLHAGIKRNECYITNASLYPVTGNNKDKFFFKAKNYPTDEFLDGIGALVKDIQRIKPNVVIPLGNMALWSLFTKTGIMKYRGSILESTLLPGVKLVPTIHPAALLRGKPDESSKAQGGLWKLRPVVIHDLQRAKRESYDRAIRYQPRTIIIDPIGSQLDQAEARLLEAEFITFDIESWGGTRIACIGFSPADPHLAYVFSNDGSNSRTDLYRRILESNNPKVAQNGMYDITMLDQNQIHVVNLWHDTMLAQHVLYPEHPRGLDFLCSVYTDIPYYKDEGKVWNMPKTEATKLQYFNYNGKDVCATTEIALKQREELQEEKLMDVFQREMGMFEPLRWATYHGMKCDVRLLEEYIIENNKKLIQAENALKSAAGYDFNPNSPKQMAKLLYEDLKLPARTKHGKLKTDALTLKDIEARTGDPIVGKVLTYRSAQKLKSNYYTKGILSPDQRIRSTWRIDGTMSGRLSSSAPLWGTGLNGQNIPPSARRFMIADDGFELLELDQSQAEAVIVAYLADDPVHMDCFRHGKDVHRVTACYLIGEDPNNWQKIDKKSSMRQLAKKCNHALNYYMQWMTFMLNVNAEHDPDDPNSPSLNPQTAKLVYSTYMQSRPALPSYWEKIKAQLRENRTLINLLGRPHVFMDLWSDTMLRQAYSYIPQSTVGDATNQGIEQIYNSDDDDIKYLFKHGLRLWNQVHDSATFMIPKGAREYIPKLMQAMEVPLYCNGYQLIIPIDASIGPNWNKEDHEQLGKSRISVEPEYEPAYSD